MSENEKNQGHSESYHIGQVGPHARVAQGKNISWAEGASSVGGEDLLRRFSELLDRIDTAPDLTDDERLLARQKTEQVAASLASAQESPSRFRLALTDAKRFFATTASWVWDGIVGALKSDAAQQALSTISEAGTRAAIAAMLGGT